MIPQSATPRLIFTPARPMLPSSPLIGRSGLTSRKLERPGAHPMTRLFLRPQFYGGACRGSSERRSSSAVRSTLYVPPPSLDLDGGGSQPTRGPQFMTTQPVGASAPVVFSFVSTSLRVVLRDGEPWFVAVDVCEALTIGNSRMATERLDDDEKGVSSIDTPSGTQQMTVINESGLYSLILGSRKPEAKRFKKWVTSEVLPAIRRTGKYEAKPAPVGPAEEPISAADRNNLAWLVSGAVVGLWGQQAWEWAIWKALRDVTGCPSPQPFKVHQLPTIVVELRRILAITSALRDAQIETSKQVIKRCIRNREDTANVLAEMQVILDQAVQENEAALIARLKPFEVAALAGLSKAPRAMESRHA